MSIKNILSQMQEIRKQLGEEIKNPISVQQEGLIIDCNEVESLAEFLIFLSEDSIVSINLIISEEERRPNPNLAYLAQLERLRCILELLISKLQSISCSEECPELLEELFCILVKIYSLLDAFYFVKFFALDFYRDNPIFFECFLCDLIEEITDLENLVKELICIIIELISCETDNCTPCYVATNSNKRPRTSINLSLNQKNFCKR